MRNVKRWSPVPHSRALRDAVRGPRTVSPSWLYMSGFFLRSSVIANDGFRARSTRDIIIQAFTSQRSAYGMPLISDAVSSCCASASSRGQRNCWASRSDQPVAGEMSSSRPL